MGRRLGLEIPVVEGEIDQIDYDTQDRITVIHVLQPDGFRDEIRFTYPAEPLPDLMLGQQHYAIFRQSRRPEVSVVRLA
jgi:hypothetical protein